MLSDEEREGIEIEDSISILENTDLDINNIYSIDLRTYNVAVKTVVEVIKKQSKEIEELREKNFELEYLDTGKIMKNKIKAKIEELEKYRDKFDERNMLQDVIIKQNQIQVLQSLIEKE